ncbi:MAG: serine/threonine protein kinase [Phycisphaerales bacterium]|jgi:serine/threonine protein kinase
MNPAQRDQAQRLFEEAIRGGTPDPASWVATQTIDAQVLAEVKRLLTEHSAHLTHAEHLPVETPSRLADALLNQILGDYRIEKLIGSGGMGRVYLARSTTETTREVAMKVLGRAVTSQIAIQRFAREAEVMKKLNHPAIASFYASGMYDDGEGAVPWFAMEYIANAQELTMWCDNKHLGLRERLSIVAEISDAIGHAHRMGIVHRDLKPANILVAVNGSPKVIDFGVARCLGNDSEMTSVQTQTGQLVGTMQYMSPEQFAGDPRKIDQRADVYALGVILFELISGTYPHDVRALSVHEAARVVCDVDAPDIRSTTSEVDEELSGIVAKCLRRERSERFADARELGSKLRSWLCGEPMSQPVAVFANEPAIAGRNRPIREPKQPHILETDTIRRSSGWLVPTLSVLLVTIVGLVATDTLKPQWLVDCWRKLLNSSGVQSAQEDLPAVVESISIESDPSGARVTIDGLDIGVTPIRSSIAWKQNSQNAMIIISKSSFQTHTESISAAPRGGRTAPLRMHVRLDPAATITVP